MHIRTLTPDDLRHASALCLDSFMQAVVPSLLAQGVETFTKVAAPQAFAERMQGDHLTLVGVLGSAIAGLIELKEGRHVAMLFIAPGWQRQGIDARLMNAVLQHARVEVVTVKASLSSMPAYQRYCFTLAGAVGEIAGLV